MVGEIIKVMEPTNAHEGLWQNNILNFLEGI
jgi:hypothetical protein